MKKVGVYTSSLQAVVGAASGVAGRGVDAPPHAAVWGAGVPLRKPSGKETQVWQQWGGSAAMLSACDPDTWEADGMDVGACSVRGWRFPQGILQKGSWKGKLHGCCLFEENPLRTPWDSWK